MPKPRKNELIRCAYFAWRLQCRSGVWYADGRFGSADGGRHSLGTKDHEEALRLLPELDRRIAEDCGLIPRSAPSQQQPEKLGLAEGRRLYEEHLKRPRATGGVRPSTQKRYRAVFDKFIPFAESSGLGDWREVDAKQLERYAAHLERESYRHKTLVNELTTLKQAIRWMIAAGHLAGKEPINLPLRKAESERAYCWTPEEVEAIVNFCYQHKQLHWLGDVSVALACTGLRIGELSALRWTDVDLRHNLLTLSDETAHGNKPGFGRRHLKTGRGRSFPIHPDLLAVLVRQRRSDAFIFHGPRGGRLKPDHVRNVLVKKVIEELAPTFPSAEGAKGFADGRLHSFRHFFCSFCANNNKPEQLIMQWLGHSSSDMVRHYYHVADKAARAHMESLNFIGSAGKKITG
jgi:integrase